MAHPYAPMGGCYDDPVVGIAAAQLLKEGFIVCTLNFRCVEVQAQPSCLLPAEELLGQRVVLRGLRSQNKVTTSLSSDS